MPKHLDYLFLQSPHAFSFMHSFFRLSKCSASPLLIDPSLKNLDCPFAADVFTVSMNSDTGKLCCNGINAHVSIFIRVKAARCDINPLTRGRFNRIAAVAGIGHLFHSVCSLWPARKSSTSTAPYLIIRRVCYLERKSGFSHTATVHGKEIVNL